MPKRSRPKIVLFPSEMSSRSHLLSRRRRPTEKNGNKMRIKDRLLILSASAESPDVTPPTFHPLPFKEYDEEGSLESLDDRKPGNQYKRRRISTFNSKKSRTYTTVQREPREPVISCQKKSLVSTDVSRKNGKASKSYPGELIFQNW